MQSLNTNNTLKTFLKSCLIKANIPQWWSSITGKYVIFMYHGVIEKISDPYLDRWCITKKIFEEQIKFLEERFCFVTLTELINNITEPRKIKKPYAVLTFDDAFVNIFEHAFPLLHQKAIPFVVGVPAGLITNSRSIWSLEIDLIATRYPGSTLSCPGNAKGPQEAYSLETREERISTAQELKQRALLGNNPNPYKFAGRLIAQIGEELYSKLINDMPHLKIMTAEQLKQMIDNNVEIACHGFYHVPLSSDNHIILDKEINQSKIRLKELLALTDISHYILAHGIYNDRVIDMIRRAGYLSCLTMKFGRINHGENLLQLPRVNATTEVCELIWKLAR